MRDASDEELLEAVRAGDTDQLGLLVARWEQPLFRFVYRMLPRREDARDICQETFLRVLGKAHRFRRGSRFSTWMYQIALNLCRDLGRRKRRWSKVVVEWPESAGHEGPRDLAERADEASSPEDEAAREGLRQTVRRALDELPPPLREVLVLKQYEEMTFREIARLLDCPESTVKSRLYDGLDRLRKRLEGVGPPG